MDGTVHLVVLDRDGVINHDSDAFIKTPDEWSPLPGTLEAIARLSRAGLPLAICSNQSGVGRGLISSAALSAITRKMMQMIREHGGSVSMVRYCPHTPHDHCRCRKPQPGMINDLCRHFGVLPSSTVLVGDALRDIEAAQAAGSRAALVLTGHGRRTLQDHPTLPAAGVSVFATLHAFAESLLATR